MRAILTLALCAALWTTTRAQAPSLAGRWTVTTEGASGTTDGGSSWTLGAMTGALTLTEKGKEIAGSWKGQMPAAWELTGQLDDRAFVLRTEWRDIPATRNGESTTAKARWIFRGTISGESAAGTMTLEVENDGGNRSQPFKATRAK